MKNGEKKLIYVEENVLKIAKALTEISNLASIENISRLKRFKASDHHEWLMVENRVEIKTKTGTNPEEEDFPTKITVSK